MLSTIEIFALVFIIVVIILTTRSTIKSILLNRRIDMVEQSIKSTEYNKQPIERRIHWQEYSQKNIERLESLDRLAECDKED